MERHWHSAGRARGSVFNRDAAAAFHAGAEAILGFRSITPRAWGTRSLAHHLQLRSSRWRRCVSAPTLMIKRKLNVDPRAFRIKSD
jgi:hypothetical protein